jgi:peroxiredoxin family protein
MEVTMFFTFWGLRALKKKVKTGKSFMGKMFGAIYWGDIERAGPRGRCLIIYLRIIS